MMMYPGSVHVMMQGRFNKAFKPKDFAKFTADFMQKLPKFMPSLTNVGKMREVDDGNVYAIYIEPFHTDQASMHRYVLEVFDDNPAESNLYPYLYLSDEGKIIDKSLRSNGWSTPYLYEQTNNNGLYLRRPTIYLGGLGGYDWNEIGYIEAIIPSHSPEANFSNMLQLLAFFRDCFDTPLFGAISTCAFEEKLNTAYKKLHTKQVNNMFPIGVVTYLNYSPITTYLSDTLDAEFDEKGGISLYATRTGINAEDTVQIEKGLAVRRELDRLHLTQTYYAIKGWPIDQHEVAYAHQITGAPPGRKYLLSFCYFDGYDASRDVLLFAKLFHIKYQPNYTMLRVEEHCAQYVAEARRQIDAVDTAGLETPIEWHIGIELHAKNLQAVFAYHKIPESRLKVIYTSYEEKLTQ